MRSWRARPASPGTLLSQRLSQLERLGVVKSAPKPDGRGHHYKLTSAGRDLFAVCQSLGEWGARWLEIAPEHLDPFVALWSMCNALRRTGFRIIASSSVLTSLVARALSAIGYSSNSETPRSAKRNPASTRTCTSRRTPKRSSNGTPANFPGRKPSARAASNLTARRRWQEPSRLGTPAACSRTSGRSPALQAAPQADILDGSNSAFGAAEPARPI